MNKLLKKEILCYLENQTAFFDLEHMNEVFTAQRLADHFGVKRNTVSHYLNQLNDEQLLVKINSRPVIYFDKEAFEKQFPFYFKPAVISKQTANSPESLPFTPGFTHLCFAVATAPA